MMTVATILLLIAGFATIVAGVLRFGYACFLEHLYYGMALIVLGGFVFGAGIALGVLNL